MIAGLQREVDHLQSKHKQCVEVLTTILQRMEVLASGKAPTVDDMQRLRNLTSVALLAIERIYCPQCAD